MMLFVLVALRSFLQQKHVQDDLAAVTIKQARTHRQYMNRCVVVVVVLFRVLVEAETQN